MMTERHDIQPALDHLEAALAASCATLMVLEAGADSRPDATLAAQGEIRQAIACLREAIAEVRALGGVRASMLAFGFVLTAGPERAQTSTRQASRDVHLNERAVGAVTYSERARRLP